MGKVNFLGVELQSPFIVGSGPLSYDANGLIRLHEAGAGAVVIKTIRGETCINPNLSNGAKWRFPRPYRQA